MGVNSAFRRICRAVNSRLASSVELTAVKAITGCAGAASVDELGFVAAGGGGCSDVVLVCRFCH